MEDVSEIFQKERGISCEILIFFSSMRGSFNRENNELAIKVLEQTAQLAQVQAQLAQANYQLALKDQVIEDLNDRLDERKTSPSSRKRERDDYVEFDHESDIYVGDWNKAGVNFEPFKEFLKEKYGIDAIKVTGVGKNQSFSRLHMKNNEDQKKFLYNLDEIRGDFGLKGVIRVFRERRYN